MMSRISFRSIHTSMRRCEQQASLIQAPKIRHIDSLKDNGILGLYTPKGLDTVWYSRVENKLKDLEYGVSVSTQRSILERCFVEETAPASGNVSFEFQKQTSISKFRSVLAETAKKADDSLVYQAAGSIYGSYYFVSSLVPNMRASNSTVSKPDESALFESTGFAKAGEVENGRVPEKLLNAIRDSFGSLSEFRTLLLGSANAIKGDGYTWLVSSIPDSQHHSRSFDPIFIVNTYNSGVPDNVIRGGQVSTLRKFKKESGEAAENNNPGKFPSLEESQEHLTPKNLTFKPLLAINASPSAYLPDYGVFGKAKYLNNVWDCIDWSVVENRLPQDFIARERIAK